MTKEKELKWEDLTIGQYLDIEQLLSEHEEDNETEDVTRMIKLIYILFDIDMENVPIGQALELQNEVTKFMNERADFDKLLKDNKLNKIYKLGQYECQPIGIDSMTMSQFIDFNNYANSGENNLINTLSVCLVPIGHKYNDGYDLEEIKEHIKKLKYVDAITISRFFVKRLKKSLRHSLNSLAGQAMMTKGMSMKEKMYLVKMTAALYRILDFSTMQ